MSVAKYELKVNGGGFSDYIIDTGNVTSYNINGLEADTEYDIEVRAVDNWGNKSDWSEVETATTFAFDPDDITGRILKLAADDLTLSNGDGVPLWADTSGEGNDAEQSISGNQPTFLTNQQNGLPAVQCIPANSDYLILPDFVSGLTEAEIFIVVTGDEPAPNGNFGMFQFGTVAQAEVFGSNFGEAIGVTFGRSDAQYFTPSSSVRERALVYNCSIEAGTNGFTARINGVQEFQDTPASVAFTPTPFIGVGYGSFFNGRFFEVWLYDHVLTLGERNVVNSFLMGKWGIT